MASVYLTFCFILACLLNGFAEAQDYCYITDLEPNRYYGVKTKYSTFFNESFSWDGVIEGCEPTIFYMVSRHGSRYSEDVEIAYMGEWLPLLQEHISTAENELCEEDVANINNWQMRQEVSDHMQLAEEGWEEFRGLGRRYKEIYPDLLGAPYDPSVFEFVHTESSTNRTRDSARAFAEGLFDSFDAIAIIENPEEEDWLLLFYNLCEKYLELVANQPIEEQLLFKNGQEVNDTKRNIERRLGLQEERLSDTDTAILFETCRTEHGIFSDSPWCAAFEDADVKVLEYYDDITYYWLYGYPYEINYEMACGLLVDAMTYLRMIDGGEDNPTVATRYGHLGSISALLTRIGLFNDGYNLTADGFDESQDRTWRISTTTLMASNIAFVRYECSEEDDKIAVLVDERLIDLPVAGCSGGVCDITDLMAAWGPIAESCDLEEICAI